jgi:hypothetical protein
MKTIISLLTTMVFVFAFGTAFADDWPMDKISFKFLGTELRDEVFPVQKAEVMEPGAAAGGLRAERIDKSTVIVESLLGRAKSTDLPDPYGDFFKHETMVGVKGAAPGGLRAEKADRGSEIVESLFGERGNKAETNIAY